MHTESNFRILPDGTSAFAKDFAWVEPLSSSVASRPSSKTWIRNRISVLFCQLRHFLFLIRLIAQRTFISFILISFLSQAPQSVMEKPFNKRAKCLGFKSKKKKLIQSQSFGKFLSKQNLPILLFIQYTCDSIIGLELAYDPKASVPGRKERWCLT